METQEEVVVYPKLSFRHKLRGYFRLINFALTTLYYVLKVAFFALLLGDERRRALRIRKQWAKRMVRIMAIRVRQEGPLPKSNELIIANHRSYIDPVIILRDCLSSVVAKAEVGAWPVIGWGVKVSHVVLVKRESTTSRRNTRSSVKEWLESGFSLIIFPEGTTHAGPGILPLKPGMFHMVAKDGFKVVPVAISYRDPQDAWVGDDTFIRHFIQCFGKPQTEVRIRYGEPIEGTDGALVQQQVEDWLNHELRQMDADWN